MKILFNLMQSHFYVSKSRLHKNARRFFPLLQGRVLDVGAGSQPFRIYLGRSVAYTSMDINEAKSPDIVGSVLDMDLDPETFDAVICTEVLEHVPDPLKTLCNINRVLKPDGKLYLTAPMTWGLHYEPHDYYRYTKYGLQWLLDQSGFEVIQIGKIGGVFIAILARLEDYTKSVLYKFAFPLKFLIGDPNRIYAVSIVIFPIILILDVLATLLDKIIPQRWDKDALGWVVLATRRKSIK